MKESQSTLILRALESGRKLTPIDALNDFGCMRLGGRIWDLKQQGYDTQTEDYLTPSGKHVARYFLPDVRQLRLI